MSNSTDEPTRVVPPSEPARWERGRYVTAWKLHRDRGVPRYRRWVRTEDGWDQETRELWEMEHDSR